MFGPMLIVVAIIIGILSAMTGLGGGSLIVPVLVLLFGVEIHQAVGTSLVTIIFTATSAMLAYARQKRIDYRVGLILTATTVPGAIIGAYLTIFASEQLLIGLFGVFLIIIALKMMRKEYTKSNSHGLRRKLIDSEGISFDYEARVVPGLVLGLLGGIISGLFGVGGGAVMVPVMVMVVGLPIHIAIAVSMFIMIFTSVSGAMTHLAFGHVIPEYVLYLSIGIIFGTQIGAALARKLESRLLQKIFSLILALVGLRMILELI